MSSTPTAQRRRRRRWIWGLLLLVVAGLTAGLLLNGGLARGPKSLSVDDLDIRVGKAEVGDVQVSVIEVGTIEPLVKVDVKSALSGKVTELVVREGDRVRTGQVLAKVEPDVNQAQTLSQVRSDLRQAEIQAEDARRDIQMNERLFEEGYLSDQQMKALRLRFETTLESLDAAMTRARIVEESGIPLQGEISTTQRVSVLSPMDGYVILRGVEVGQTVTSGTSSFNEGTIIYTVADLGSMQIEASINEVDIGKVRMGMPVVITVDAFPYRRFGGAVTHISPAARLKDKVKVFDIEVTLEEQTEDFRAGMTANVEVRGDKVTGVLAAPVESIFRKNDREVVYVLRDEFGPPDEEHPRTPKTKAGKVDVSEIWERFFTEQPVKVGLVSLEKAEILEGLKEGAKLALEDPTRSREIEED